MAAALWIVLLILLGALLVCTYLAVLWLVEAATSFVLAGTVLLWVLCVLRFARVRRSPIPVARVADTLGWATSPRGTLTAAGLAATGVLVNVLLLVVLGPVPWLGALTGAQVVALGLVLGSLRRYERAVAKYPPESLPSATVPALSLVGLLLCGLAEYGIKRLDWLDLQAHNVTQLALCRDGKRGWALGRTSAVLVDGVWDQTDVYFTDRLIDST